MAHNQPGWHELMTNDLEASKKFYLDLFGWTTIEVPSEKLPGGKYTIFSDPKHGPHCGVLVPPEGGPKPQWTPYFIVDDVKATYDRAIAAGANEMISPCDVGMGTLAMMTDPNGAIFSAWKSHKTDRDGDLHPTFNFELLVAPSTEESWKFYSAVFPNWERLPVFGMIHFKDSLVWGGFFSAKETPCDTGKPLEGEAHAATQAEIKAADDESYWLSYIAVDDVDAVVEKAKKLGAKMLVNPCDIPEVDGLPTSGTRLAGFLDPQGARVGIMKLKVRDVKAKKSSESCCASLAKTSCETSSCSSGPILGPSGTDEAVAKSAKTVQCETKCASEKSGSCASVCSKTGSAGKLTNGDGVANGKHEADKDASTVAAEEDVSPSKRQRKA